MSRNAAIYYGRELRKALREKDEIIERIIENESYIYRETIQEQRFHYDIALEMINKYERLLDYLADRFSNYCDECPKRKECEGRLLDRECAEKLKKYWKEKFSL
nr:MAG TPA: hypothetical protein [Caudoviricetes sp.]